MRRRRKARPGITTEQAKFNSPIKDCSSFNCTFFRVINDETRALHLTISSADKRASIRTVSSSIPAKVRTHCGPAVFSWAIGTPKVPHRCKNFSRLMRHWTKVGVPIRKSSNICIRVVYICMWNG